MKKLTSLLIIAFLAAAACKKDISQNSASTEKPDVSLDSVTAIAKQAWIYGYPIFYNYKAMYANAVNKDSKTFVGGFNTFKSSTASATPKDTLVVTINNDTPYSMAALNVSDEPLVLQIPKIEAGRYFVMQFIDLYTFNYEYLGSRVSGNNGGSYLIAGPDWKGEKPKGIDKVLRSETNLIFLLGRTELDSPDDIPNLKKIQDQYRLIPLHEFTNQAAPAVKKYPMPLPPWKESDYSSAEFINVINALLQYTKQDSSEKALRAEFAKIGIVPGVPFESSKLDAQTLKAIEKGIAEAKQELEAGISTTTDAGNLFGTRESLKNNYLNRAIAAAMGLYGNTKEEAVYTGSMVDSDNKPLSGKNNYVLRFSKEQLPKAKYFWSITLYNLPKRFLVPNPISRYSIGQKTKGLKYEADGGLIIYLYAGSPGRDKQSNWLPTPGNENFNFVMRIYGPDPSAVNGTWKVPLPQKVK